MAGFQFRYRLCGAMPTIQDILFKDTETLTKGDFANLESGEIDLAATADANLLGAIYETQAGTDSTTRARVITDDDAVYAVEDANARKIGDVLDIRGATGAQGVTSATNREFIVVAESSATQKTLVRVNTGKHFLNKAQ